MSTIRPDRKSRIHNENTGNFTTILNQALRDPRMSWKARGILATMRSFAEGWVFYASRLETLSRDGRDALRTGLSELERLGYLRRQVVKDGQGRFVRLDYYVTDAPRAGDGFSGPGEGGAGEAATKKNKGKKNNPQEEQDLVT